MGVINLYRLREFLFRFCRYNTIKKQWYRPNRVPGIAYLFKLLKGVSHTCANENVRQFGGFVERIMEKA